MPNGHDKKLAHAVAGQVNIKQIMSWTLVAALASAVASPILRTLPLHAMILFVITLTIQFVVYFTAVVAKVDYARRMQQTAGEVLLVGTSAGGVFLAPGLRAAFGPLYKFIANSLAVFFLLTTLAMVGIGLEYPLKGLILVMWTQLLFFRYAWSTVEMEWSQTAQFCERGVLLDVFHPWDSIYNMRMSSAVPNQVTVQFRRGSTTGIKIDESDTERAEEIIREKMPAHVFGGAREPADLAVPGELSSEQLTAYFQQLLNWQLSQAKLGVRQRSIPQWAMFGCLVNAYLATVVLVFQPFQIPHWYRFIAVIVILSAIHVVTIVLRTRRLRQWKDAGRTVFFVGQRSQSQINDQTDGDSLFESPIFSVLLGAFVVAGPGQHVPILAIGVTLVFALRHRNLYRYSGDEIERLVWFCEGGIVLDGVLRPWNDIARVSKDDFERRKIVVTLTKGKRFVVEVVNVEGAVALIREHIEGTSPCDQ
ncbi:MAG: hypothetical protein KDB27_23235 [Planctomycetales bacterium]|nr:hypothetical protein [Planctomycetales bacterium]